MNLSRLLTSFALTLSLGVLSANVQASYMHSCSGGSYCGSFSDVTSPGDVSFGILPGSPQFASDSIQSRDSFDLAAVNALGGNFAGDPWFYLDRTNRSPQEFEGVTFNLTADIGSSAGNWSLSWADTGEPGLPLSMDFLFVTKAGCDWGAYLFQSYAFTSDPGSGDGTFEIPWENKKGKNPKLEKAVIYGRKSGGEEPPVEPPPGVPVPGTLALLGLALLPLGWHLNRRPANTVAA